jgi:ATP-binding cassette, subfamily B, bacterial
MGEVALYRRLLRLVRPYWLHFAGLFALGLLASPIALLSPVPLKLVVDSVLGDRPLPPMLVAIVHGVTTPATILALAVALLMAVTLLGQLQGLANNLLRTYVGERLVFDFRARLIDQIHHLSLSYHDARGTTDSIYRVQEDAPAIQNIMVDGVVPVVTAAFTLVMMVVVTARLDAQLALVALAISPPLFLLSRVYRPRLRRHSRRVKTLESSALGMVQETLAALRVVKAFGQEAREKDRVLRRLSDGMTARIQLALLSGGYGVLIGLVTSLGVAAVLLIGVRHVRAGVLTLGQLLMVLSYLGQLYEPLKTMSRKATGLQSYLASAERVFALLDERPDVPERPDARPLGRAAGAVAFRGVGFAYASGHPVLEDVSFEIRPGTRLGIVGASGAGKSTLISLLTRFYDPMQGQIQLDGVDLRDYKLSDLRRQFAVVPQDPVLFSATIAENIAYARPGAGREELIAAAQAANAHEFILSLPQGYDTEVGDRGVQLSGGQRQRVAIARAFLKDSPVLILDEPTSAVDAEAESAIRGAIRHLMRGRTVILITHRPSMLESCQVLLVLEHGRVISDTILPPKRVQAPARSDVPDGTRSNLARHPAVLAWSGLFPRAQPSLITPLRLRRKKSMVYRLEGEARAGFPVIAKRCPQSVALIERTVYERILPRLPLPTLSYHGFVDDPGGEYGWLFMEEATGIDFSNLLAEHRSHAAHWLAQVHAAAADLGAPGSLPDAGPARYRDVLRSVRACTSECLPNPVLSTEDIEFLEGVIVRLDELDEHWRRVEETCDCVPRTLVHGDFNGRNIRLRSTNGGEQVVVFDWEEAGWGIPAVDLAQLTVASGQLSANPDVATYWSARRERWPEASLDACKRLADCGTVFRALSAISWIIPNLANDWAHASLRDMRLYVTELDGALERLGWRHCASLRQRKAVAL